MTQFNPSGSKYLRSVPCITDGKVDVYAVLDAFAVTCPARQHAIKKLLCSGIRGKGDVLQDLKEAADAADRALQMETQRMLVPLSQPEVGKNPAPLCHVCQRNAPLKCHGKYPATKDGGCEGYIPALRERVMEAKEEAAKADNCVSHDPRICVDCHLCPIYAKAEAPKPAPVALAICPSCSEHPGCKGTVDPAEDGSCKGFSAKEAASDAL